MKSERGWRHGHDDTHQGTDGTQGDGSHGAKRQRPRQGTHPSPAPRGDVRPAAGAACPRGQKAKDERQAALTRIWREEDAERVSARSMSAATETTDEPREVSLREAIGHVLRDLRTHDHKTLREVSEKAGVSLGYLSEVERGQKEASSELLSSIAQSLGVSTAQMLRMVADYLDSVAI